LAFLSDRAQPGIQQPYRIPIDGGEAEPLPQSRGRVTDLMWSPDGASFALIVVEPDSEDWQARLKTRDDARGFGDDWRAAHVWTLRLDGGQLNRVTADGRHACAAAWSPDSASIAVLSQDSPWEDAYYGPLRLDLYPAQGGPAKNLATIKGPATHLCWSRDGSLLAMSAAESRVHTPGAFTLVSAVDGTTWLPWPGFPGTVEWLTWVPDGNALIVAALQDLAPVLLRVNLDQNGLTRDSVSLLPEEFANRGNIGDDVSISADGRTIALLYSRADTPAELWAGPIDDVRQRSRVNASIADWDIGRVEHLHWPAADGLTIGGLLFYPASYREGIRYPLVLLIHGGPDWHWAEYFPTGWAQLLSSYGYAVLLPNPRGGTGRGASFVDATWNDLGGEEMRDNLRGADAAIAMGIADPDRLGIGGWSHGGYMTAWTITQTTRFKAAVIGAGVANLVSDQGQNDIPRCNDDYFETRAHDDPDPYMRRSPITFVNRVTTPTLVLHGAADARVHPTQGREFFSALRLTGVPAEFITYPREGHAIEERLHRADLFRRILAWYDRYLKDPLAAAVPDQDR